MIESKPRNGNLGRPAGRDSEKVKADLLQAARQHFLASEFKAVSIRRIGETAGVNGAMVNYYFGGKQGLYMAMVDDLFQSLEQSLGELGKNTDVKVEDFSSSYCHLLARNPWWPNFMVREVLFGEAEMREAMIAKFSSVSAPRLLQSIGEDIASGHFRQDLNPQLTLVSLLGMTIFPFLAKPMVEKILNFKIDETAAVALAEHNTQLFLRGVEETSAGGSQS